MKQDDEFIVDVQHLHKSFGGIPAVSDVSLKIKRGEIFGFLGPNGSGKTTTIRMLCGLMTPDSGSGTCLGFDLFQDSESLKRLVGYVPQAFSLYQDLTVRENLEFMARVYNLDNYQERTKNIMAELGLDAYENQYAGNLSGGWKQRLSLASALIHDPQLLLLDEPTAGVDPKARRDFWDQIALLTTRGITSLVSTHYMDEAERCNRLAYIVLGKLMAEGTIPQIRQQFSLVSYDATGPDLSSLAKLLRKEAGVEQVVMWGNDLRIAGTDPDVMSKVVERYQSVKWKSVTATLEEVFVHLYNQRTQNAG